MPSLVFPTNQSFSRLLPTNQSFLRLLPTLLTPGMLSLPACGLWQRSKSLVCPWSWIPRPLRMIPASSGLSCSSSGGTRSTLNSVQTSDSWLTPTVLAPWGRGSVSLVLLHQLSKTSLLNWIILWRNTGMRWGDQTNGLMNPQCGPQPSSWVSKSALLRLLFPPRITLCWSILVFSTGLRSLACNCSLEMIMTSTTSPSCLPSLQTLPRLTVQVTNQPQP